MFGLLAPLLTEGNLNGQNFDLEVVSPKLNLTLLVSCDFWNLVKSELVVVSDDGLEELRLQSKLARWTQNAHYKNLNSFSQIIRRKLLDRCAFYYELYDFGNKPNYLFVWLSISKQSLSIYYGIKVVSK